MNEKETQLIGGDLVDSFDEAVKSILDGRQPGFGVIVQEEGDIEQSIVFQSAVSPDRIIVSKMFNPAENPLLRIRIMNTTHPFEDTPFFELYIDPTKQLNELILLTKCNITQPQERIPELIPKIIEILKRQKKGVPTDELIDKLIVSLTRYTRKSE